MIALVAVLGGSLAGTHAAKAASSHSSPPVTTNTPYGEWTHFGKSHLVQDAQWLADKQARARQRHEAYLKAMQTARTQTTGATPYTSGIPNGYLLGGTVVTSNTEEPLGNGPNDSLTPDVASFYYTDHYMWGLCGEGATTNALYYWGRPINSTGLVKYTDPHVSTTWDDGNNRSYLMWLATEVMVPGWGTPGEAAYGAYPAITTYTTDLRDTLNWEASGENTSNWSNFYYGIVWAANLSQSDLNADIMSDIGIDHRADVVGVNALYLPNWQGHDPGLPSVVSHYVAIIGYDNNNGTYTYLDSCGTQCGAPGGYGLFTVSQSTLHDSIENNNGNGSLVW